MSKFKEIWESINWDEVAYNTAFCGTINAYDIAFWKHPKVQELAVCLQHDEDEEYASEFYQLSESLISSDDANADFMLQALIVAASKVEDAGIRDYLRDFAKRTHPYFPVKLAEHGLRTNTWWMTKDFIKGTLRDLEEIVEKAKSIVNIRQDHIIHSYFKDFRITAEGFEIEYEHCDDFAEVSVEDLAKSLGHVRAEHIASIMIEEHNKKDKEKREYELYLELKEKYEQN